MRTDIYNQLSESEQLNFLEKSGVLIGEREGRFCHIKLYQVESFYVEVYYHTHFNVVVNIHAFTDIDYLDPYLKQMDIDSLIYAS